MSKKEKTQKREIPQWLEAGSRQAVDIARGIADRPYTPYEEQRFAEAAPGEQRAMELAMGPEAQAYRTDVERSRELAERGARSWLDLTPEEREAYQSPYIQEALEPAAREMREEGLRMQQQMQSQAAMASAFGGSRSAILQAEATEKPLQALSDLYAQGYQKAFESAQSMFDKDRVAARASSDQFRQLGSEGQRMLANEMQNLLVTGGLQRQLEQQNLDFDYGQFIEARDWDVTNLEPLLKTLAQVPHGETMTTTEKGGEFQAVLGAAATVAGAYFTGGASLAAQGGASAASQIAGSGGAPSMSYQAGFGGFGDYMQQNPEFLMPTFD